MIRMLKQAGNDSLHWRVWQNGKQLTIEFGKIGELTNVEEKKLSFFQSGKKRWIN